MVWLIDIRSSGLEPYFTVVLSIVTWGRNISTIQHIKSKQIAQWLDNESEIHITYHLTHWGRVTHICVGKLTIIGSYNGLSPGRCQAIIWTNAGIFLIEPLGTNFSEILIGIQIFSLKKMHLKMSSAKWRPFCIGLNVLKHWARNKFANVCN